MTDKNEWDQYRLKKGMSEHDKAKAMYKLYLEKVPVIQIAKEYGITREAVYQKFRSFGMPLKAKKKVLRHD